VPHVTTVLAKLGALKGLWHYLTVRSQLHADLEKERLRNRAFAEHRDRLPDHAELMDYEDREGRKFWIRKTGPGGRPPDPALPPTVVLELEALPTVELPPTTDSRPAGELNP
jgi:hypothetical protein